jgi:dipeptidyl aminopeptidase/acylaminoacyl peptidase
MNDELNKESEKLLKLYQEYAKFYDMPEGTDLLEITDLLLNNPYVMPAQKQSIKQFDRRCFVFSYLSEGLKVKGAISFTPNPSKNPFLLSLRGGNRIFGLTNPGEDFMCLENYTILAPTYRGGICEGTDLFGGDDVNDIKTCLDYLPELEKKLQIQMYYEKMYMLGGSRGGLQMFLFLARFPIEQSRFIKIASLSGLLDINICYHSRSDMKELFTEEFGLIEGTNDREWLKVRNPLLAAEQLQYPLPVLIIQGTGDNRVALEQGYNMIEKLQDLGIPVSYIEIEGGKHCLSNIKNRVNLILNWFENQKSG